MKKLAKGKERRKRRKTTPVDFTANKSLATVASNSVERGKIKELSF